MELDKVITLLEEWEAEMTLRWSEALEEEDRVKQRLDFYHRRMLMARNNLNAMKELRQELAKEGGAK